MEISLKRRVLPVLVLAVALILGACSSSPSSSSSAASSAPAPAALKVAFVYVGVPGDLGWTFEHDRGRKELQAALGDKVVTTGVENVPEGPAGKKTFEDLARKGYKLIFGTSFGYMDQMLAVSKEFPDVKFMHCAGYKTSPNMGTYFGAAEEARYLSGMIAGAMSKSGKIGFVAAFPIPEVVRGINAFELGAQVTNPKAVTKVVWTSTWFDPNIEKQAALSLLNAGSDVLAQHQDSAATGEAAQSRGAYWISYDSDMRTLAPKAWLAGPGWDWGPFYIAQAKAVLAGTWKSQQYYGNMGDGLVKLYGPSANVPAAVAAKVKAVQDLMVAGTFHPFDGPIVNQSGKALIAKGATVDFGSLMSMDYFVKGVVGTVKK